MVIRYKQITDDGIIIEQVASRPTIYLDNWAINLLSFDKALNKNFVKTSNKLSGTLAISVLNIMEIVKRSDSDQISKINNLLDSVDGVFINVNASEVIEKEKKFIPKVSNCPCIDEQLLRDHAKYAHDPLKPFRISEVIVELRKEMINGNYTLDVNFERELFPIIENCRKDKKSLIEAKKRFKDKTKRLKLSPPYTEDLYHKCIDYIAINEEMKMPDSEWIDLLHTVVPVAYCDFVLIDKRWISFILSTGFKNPDIARIYYRNDMSRFLSDLDRFKS